MSQTGAFTISDCENIIKLFQKAPRNKASYNLLRQSSNEDMLRDLKESRMRFIRDMVNSKAPTKKQFTDEMSIINANIKRLKNKIKEPKNKDLHSGLLFSSLKNKNFSDVEYNEFLTISDKTEQRLRKFILELDWLENLTTPLLNDDSSYPYLRKRKNSKEPETLFIVDLSNILTKHFFKTGGYSKSLTVEEGASGWRIEAIKHLLNKVGIKKKNKQIYDAIA